MRTYITYFGKNGKTATQANTIKEASEKMSVPISKVSFSNIHITILKDYEIIK